MANLFDVNKAVAISYVRAEQVKGLFIAQAKLILVLLSGAMMLLGIVLAAADVHSFTWAELQPKLALLVPVSVVAALLAICIEGGTIFCGALVKESRKQASQELSLLDRVKAQYTAAEYAKRASKIKRNTYAPIAMLLVCSAFSICGAEIFWQKLLQDQPVFFHVIGAVLGVVCSSLLMLFELKTETVERVVERCIASSGLIQVALDQSAKSQIHNKLFGSRRDLLDSPEFVKIINNAAEQGLYGILADAVQQSGATVTAIQLQTQVEEEVAVRAAADQFLATGGQTSPQPVTASVRALPGRRVNKHRRAAAAAVKQFGMSRIVADLDKHASDLGMDRRTLEHWLEDIKQYGV
jgi:hypothetical protein